MHNKKKLLSRKILLKYAVLTIANFLIYMYAQSNNRVSSTQRTPRPPGKLKIDATLTQGFPLYE